MGDLTLAAALEQLPGRQSRKGPQCTVSKLLLDLRATDAAAADALGRVVDDPAVAPTALAGLLNDRGLSLAASTIRRHRARRTGTGCACPA